MTMKKKSKVQGLVSTSRYERPVKPGASRVFTAIERTAQTPLLEWDEATASWVVWIAYDQSRTLGSFLILHDNGRVTRIDKRVTHTDRTVVTPEFQRKKRSNPT